MKIQREAVWHGKQQKASRPDDPDHLSRYRHRVPHMFEHFKAESPINGVIRKRQTCSVGTVIGFTGARNLRRMDYGLGRRAFCVDVVSR